MQETLPKRFDLILITCYDAESKYRLKLTKKIELNGIELMSSEIRDKLASELGPIKYIEFSNTTRRCTKLLI